MYEELTLSKFTFQFLTLEEVFLHPGIIRLLKMSFLETFKKNTCADRSGDCRSCTRKEECPYTYNIEPEYRANSSRFCTGGTLPRPFIIDLPDRLPRMYAKGETVEMQLTLIGNARAHMGAFIRTFDDMCHLGLVQRPPKFKISKIININLPGGESVSEHEPPFDPAKILKESKRIHFDSLVRISENMPTDRIRLKFITPTKISNGDRKNVRPTFDYFLDSLMSRMNGMMFYAGKNGKNGSCRIAPSVPDAMTSTILVSKENLHWIPSAGGHRKMKKSPACGFVGEIEWRGNFRDLTSFFLFGEYVHVGRASLFGNGNYQIVTA